MFKRLVWFSFGAGAGVGGSLYLQRRVRRLATRLSPPAVADSVGRSARRLGGDVRAAVKEGRRAAGERLAAPPRPQPSPEGDGGTPVGSDAYARRGAP
jgi:hypothetical protein